MDRYLTSAFAALGFAVSSPALASSLQCDRTQTHCVAESTDLTIGDRVGIFNDDGELVAKGQVRAMRGERRAVLIDERHGEIHKNYHLALLDRGTASDESPGTSYKVYKEPPKWTMGTEGGYGEVGIGNGSAATEFSLFGEYRKSGGLRFVTRAVYLSMAGEVNQFTPNGGSIAQPISMTGMGLTEGLGYVWREKETISFRSEVGVGGMDVNATVNGSAALVTDPSVNTRIKNGIGLYGRGSLGPEINLDTWHIHVDYAPSLVYQAFTNTLAAGVSKDIK